MELKNMLNDQKYTTTPQLQQNDVKQLVRANLQLRFKTMASYKVTDLRESVCPVKLEDDRAMLKAYTKLK